MQFIYFLVYLFVVSVYAAASNDYTRVNCKLERIKRNFPWPDLKQYIDTCIERLSKVLKLQDSKVSWPTFEMGSSQIQRSSQVGFPGLFTFITLL